MKLIRQTWTFFVYSNLFIAACVVLMAWQTFHYIISSPANWYFLGFAFFSTLTSYSFHWYLTSHSVIPSQRIAWLKYNRHVHSIFFFTGLCGAGVFFYFIRQHWFWLMGAAIITFLYSAPKIPHPLFRLLRKVALGKTIFLAFVWMSVTTILPIIIAEVPWHTGVILYVFHRFFLIYAICILFDYRDRQDDKQAGIRSLITYLSEKNIAILFYASVFIAFATAAGMLYYHDAKTVICLIIPVIITGSLFNYARRHFLDLFYYFILDGLMALSAVLMLIAGI